MAKDKIKIKNDTHLHLDPNLRADIANYKQRERRRENQTETNQTQKDTICSFLS